MKYVVEQFVVIDKSVSSDEEFQKYVMDRRTLVEYRHFVHQFNVKRTAQLMLNNRAMRTTWTFEVKEEAEEFVKQKEAVWRNRVGFQDQVSYSYGPLVIEEVEDVTSSI